MIRMTADDLRRLADQIENREKYGSMCGVVYASIQHHPNGREYLQFEQLASMRNVIATFTTLTGLSPDSIIARGGGGKQPVKPPASRQYAGGLDNSPGEGG